MAEEDTYINEAYEVLQKLSADERKRWNMRHVKSPSLTITHG